MTTISLGLGVTFEGASGHVIHDETAGRRSLRSTDFVADDFTSVIDDALGAAELEVVADAIIAPDGAAPMRRNFDDADGPPTITVEVGENESAVLLLEDAEGVFHWQFPREEDAQRRGIGPDVLVFELTPAGDGASDRRSFGSALSWLGKKLIAPIRVRVVRFLATATIETVIDRIEGDLKLGLVVLDSSKNQWQATDRIPALTPGRTPRVLLLVHGTFSTTLGSFAAFEVLPEGRDFLKQAQTDYDIVLSVDHKTLAVDPDVNAKEMLEALAFLPHGTHIDAVAYSRGGLVLRAFHRLAGQGPNKNRFRFDKSVFVGCTNRGTLLAEPDNWDDLLDLYTNIGIAGGRALGILGSPLAGTIVTQLVKLLGGFVRALPQIGVREGQVPGLVAMRPGGKFVTDLAQEAFPVERAYAVISDFEPRPGEGNGMTAGLAKVLTDRIVDRLMQEGNDLVVHSASMTKLGNNQTITEDRVFSYAPSEGVYHTIYFLTPETIARLSDWLLARPTAAAVEPERRDGGVDGGGFGGAVPWEEVEESAAPDEDAFDWVDLNIGRPSHHYAEGSPADFGARRSIADDDDGLETWSLPDSDGGHRGISSPLPPSRASIDDLEEAPPAAAAAEPPGTAAAEEPPAKVDCHFAAEMNPTPKLGGVTPLFLTISRNKLRRAMHAAAAGNDEAVAADPMLPLDVEVLAIENCRVWSDQPESENQAQSKIEGASASQSIPLPERSDILRFLVEGVAAGTAMIQVEVTQGPVGLVSFMLEPVFIGAEQQRLSVERNAVPAQPTAQHPAVLRIYEQKVPGVGLVLKYDLVCIRPKIAVKEELVLPAGFSVEAFSAGFLQALNDAWQLSDDQYDNFLEKIAAYSVNRTNELLPVGIRQALWDNWDKLLTIQVFAENAHIPWELLYVDDPTGQNPRTDGFLGQRGLIRWVYNAPLPDEELPMRGADVRYVIPEYRDSRHTLPNSKDEKEMLEGYFPGCRPVEATTAGVTEFLRTEAETSSLLHFTCHGDTEMRAVISADLLMEGIDGRDGKIVQDRLSSEVVKRYARFAEINPAAFVFVNACKTGQTGPSIAGVTGFADAFLRPNGKRGAAGFIGALWSVGDKLALDFAKSFYDGMVKEQLTLVEAVKQARKAAMDRSDFTWLAYTVYGNPLSRFVMPDTDG
ncbi:DUF7379 domain-containing protein [Sphingobium lignivorans]|uniref:CHAT domain-containing protein n=1 Tax=Sphingobium lignivorans TaxID=2735886 RepID=A0ABR6NHL5_9SPHN|nr:CHAT domain-containing protein [Sphingobium lignivorans]MBB5986601.1 hypothetical protein [Sphingobium lignivorans]